MDVEKLIREYLPGVIHMSLGTSRDAQPWVCEVHYAYGEDLTLYFASLTTTRHSREIADNPRVAGNIVEQHQPGEKPRGVYFEGTATELSGVTTEHPAYLAYKARFGARAEILDDAENPDGLRYYQIEVVTFHVFDPRDSRPAQKYTLPWKTA